LRVQSLIVGCLPAIILLAGCQTSATNSEFESVNYAQAQPAQSLPSTPQPASFSQGQLSTGTSAALSMLTAEALDYRLNPLDVIEVSVFQVPDLTTTGPINASGLFAMPLIGAVPAAGKTSAELERDVAQRLASRYLQSPEVRVFVKEYNSQKVTVYGAVGSQGMRDVRGRTTLLQIIAQSGGLNRTADPSGIMIFREIEGQRHAALFDMRSIRRGRAPDPEVRAGDIIIVDESAVRSAWRDVREMIGAAGTFRSVAMWF
jgi:polysaccharide biosynthesis/export protein